MGVVPTETVPTEDAPTETVPADSIKPSDDMSGTRSETMSATMPATMSQREVEVVIPLIQSSSNQPEPVPEPEPENEPEPEPKGTTIAEADVASQVQSTSYGSVDLDPAHDVTDEALETTALSPPAVEATKSERCSGPPSPERPPPLPTAIPPDIASFGTELNEELVPIVVVTEDDLELTVDTYPAAEAANGEW